MAGQDGGGGEYWKWSGLGLEFAGVIALFGYFGYLAGERWHWGPWGVIGGVTLGLVGGMYWLVKEGLRMTKELCPPKEPSPQDAPEERQD